jgi:hypothetical protein
MKKLLLLCLFSLSATAFGQTCYVDMVDRYNRVVTTYTGWGDPGTCMEGMKECRKAIRMQPHLGGVDCIRATDVRPNPRPNPIPTPVPTPYPGSSSVNYYLSLSNIDLVIQAQNGIGSCSVSRGGWGAYCDYYVLARGYGFPEGTGCAQAQFNREYGCNFSSELDNAACLLRIALRNRECL